MELKVIHFFVCQARVCTQIRYFWHSYSHTPLKSSSCWLLQSSELAGWPNSHNLIFLLCCPPPLAITGCGRIVKMLISSHWFVARAGTLWMGLKNVIWIKKHLLLSLGGSAKIMIYFLSMHYRDGRESCLQLFSHWRIETHQPSESPRLRLSFASVCDPCYILWDEHHNQWAIEMGLRYLTFLERAPQSFLCGSFIRNVPFLQEKAEVLSFFRIAYFAFGSSWIRISPKLVYTWSLCKVPTTWVV